MMKPMSDRAWAFMRMLARRSISGKADVTVHGIEHLPERGPVILVVRHAHHQLDGEALLVTIPRSIHLIAATDWATGRMMKRLLTLACRQARWPTVIRGNSPFPIDQRERARLNLRAMRESINLLEEGRIVVIFPEGFPNIDRHPSPKQTDHDMLPFEPGFARLAQFAARRGVRAPMIPVGFHYARGERWTITLRFGPPIPFRERDTAAMIADAEDAVRRLSTDPAEASP